MPDAPQLTPDELSHLSVAGHDDIRQAVAHGLRFDGRKRIRYADDSLANIAADHLVRHLESCGYMILKKPTSPHVSPHSTIPMTD
jgi:hypothetical protein